MARISIFKGREARLNKAILWILAVESPLTIYDAWKKLRHQRDFAYIRYHIVNRRVKALEKQGFIERVGEKRTKTGFVAAFYKLAARAYLAMLLDQTDLDDFIEKVSEDIILSVLAAFTSVW
jgi:DNA-binding PadR family transcriptional regulator